MTLNSPNAFSFLIADDDADDQYLIQQAIKEVNDNHHCYAVTNGQQLLDLLFENKNTDNPSLPDLILLDLNMPRLGGFEALMKLQADRTLRNIPTYVLSTSRTAQDAEQSHRLGARGFFSKPARFADLKEIIQSICSQQSSSFQKVSFLKVLK